MSSTVTYFVALPFSLQREAIVAGQAVEGPSARFAIAKARALADNPKHCGAVAFSRTGNPDTGDFEDAVIIARFGMIPDELQGGDSDDAEATQAA